MSTTLRRVWAQTWFETVAVLRNGEQLLLTIMLPAIALIVLAITDLVPMPQPQPAAALGSALAMAVASSFTSQAIAVAFDRRWGVLRMLATTPLGPRGLLTGKFGAVLMVLVVQTVVLCGIAALLGWRPGGLGLTQVLAGVVFIVVGGAVFVAFAMLLGGTLRPEAVLALANLLFVLIVMGAGLVLPLDMLPAPLDTVMAFLPPGALGESLRALLTEGSVDLAALGVLAGWGVVGSLLAVRTFRWDA